MTKSKGRAKPEKPRADFPLSAHPCGQWVKRINGKLYYFGVWGDPDAALREYVRQSDLIRSGGVPSAPDRVTVKYLCNSFLTSRQLRRDRGELAATTYDDYEAAAARLMAFLGPSRSVASLGASDFTRYRQSWPKSWGAKRQANEIIRLSPIIRYAHTSGLIDRPVITGDDFRRPSAGVLRKAKARAVPKFYDADEIRRMIDIAPVQLRAMIMLGINCGYGAADCGRLTIGQLDLDSGWLAEPRHKTGIWRAAWLWPETVRALRAAIAVRPAAIAGEVSDLVFITPRKNPWWSDRRGGDSIGPAFRRVAATAGVHRDGAGFYALRHVLQTIGERTPGVSPVAIRLVMGHADHAIAETYRENFDRDQVRAVCEHVRQWLLGPIS